MSNADRASRQTLSNSINKLDFSTPRITQALHQLHRRSQITDGNANPEDKVCRLSKGITPICPSALRYTKMLCGRGQQFQDGALPSAIFSHQTHKRCAFRDLQVNVPKIPPTSD